MFYRTDVLYKLTLIARKFFYDCFFLTTQQKCIWISLMWINLNIIANAVLIQGLLQIKPPSQTSKRCLNLIIKTRTSSALRKIAPYSNPYPNPNPEGNLLGKIYGDGEEKGERGEGAIHMHNTTCFQNLKLIQRV